MPVADRLVGVNVNVDVDVETIVIVVNIETIRTSSSRESLSFSVSTSWSASIASRTAGTLEPCPACSASFMARDSQAMAHLYTSRR
jgi:hypothetical protein